MAQIFSAEAKTAAAVNVPTSTETVIVSLNALKLPYGNGKAKIIAALSLLVGTNTTAVVIKLWRNRSSEGLVLATWTMSGGFAPASNSSFSAGTTDAIPDGRDVIYTLTVQQTGGTADGTAANAYLEGTLLSG